MASQELKKLFAEYRKTIYDLNEIPTDRQNVLRAVGFNDAVELLWPLVETLTETKPYWMFKRDFDQAIKDLEQKLQRLCKSG